MANSAPAAHIDWALPPGPTDWLMGTGVTRPERRVVLASTAVAAAALVAVAARQDVSWTWWQWVLAVALVVDVAGGVPANALSTAKRLYHRDPAPGLPAAHRLARHHVTFAAVHVHVLVVALAFPDATPTWALWWYALPVAGTAVVVAAPLHLHRPLAAGTVTAAVIAAPLLDAPAGLAWLGPVLALKLVASHAVREEPYRPAPHRPTT